MCCPLWPRPTESSAVRSRMDGSIDKWVCAIADRYADALAISMQIKKTTKVNLKAVYASKEHTTKCTFRTFQTGKCMFASHCLTHRGWGNPLRKWAYLKFSGRKYFSSRWRHYDEINSKFISYKMLVLRVITHFRVMLPGKAWLREESRQNCRQSLNLSSAWERLHRFLILRIEKTHVH